MSSPRPPAAPKRPKEITVHGDTRVDEYYWLREKSSPEVTAYLEAENEYTAQVMGHTEVLQRRLYDEMVGRIQETDTGAPVTYGGYLYYTRTEEGKQYTIHCRRRGSVDAEEQVLVDLNRIVEEERLEYLTMGFIKVSPDHRLLAYSLDRDGNENFTIHFKDLETGEHLPDQIVGAAYSAEWANDCRTLYYSTQDETKRSDKLHRHVLGTTQGEDELVYHEEDKLFSLSLSKTRDKRYLLLGLGSMETTEVHLIDADDPRGMPRVIHPREKGLRYYPDHRGGYLYIVTNHGGAKNNKVVKVDAVNPGIEGWETYIPHRPDVKIDGVDLFEGHMAVYERVNGLKTMRIISLGTGESKQVEFPEEVYTYGQGSNPIFASTKLRFAYTSLTTSVSAFDLDMDTLEWALVKRQPVLGGYDPEDYHTERLFATAEDGTKVPISLVYRKGFGRDGGGPMLLYGYGSYGLSVDPAFNSGRLSLLDRGVAFAIAHVRGGGEMGRQWYEDGKFLEKRNTFTDFIACARHLVAEGYTSSDRLVAMGRSAGGLLMGAITNMAPELFKGIVAGVPFVDVVTTMLDESIPLTVGEFEEWGDPKDPEYYRYMLGYSPYDNVEEKEYPEILVTAGLNDPRVQYWEPAKWVAKLRATKTDGNRLMLKTFMGAGHFSSSGRYDYLKDTAFEYAFIIDSLGIRD
ncbi:MAG TPA: S9 family peptidase [Candidatus Krumholzibacteriaceae bacterium]|nr:S9 family peptidase [Candidatus Krumholzibacteriaceae bacterium]